MPAQIFYTLTAACFGFVSAIYLCAGSVLLTHQSIVSLAGTYWAYSEPQARAIVSQSTQYATGGLLLVVSFCVQFVAVVASPTDQIKLYPVLEKPLVFVILCLVILLLVTFCIYRRINSWREDKVIAAIKAKSQSFTTSPQ